MTGYRLLAADDPELAPSSDPARSRRRLEEALWSEAGRDDERARVVSLLDEHGSALADRTTAPGHLTGSALVVDADRQRVLLLLHTKLGRWLQPGGHADGDHELAGVALKEATEETGIPGLRVLVPAVDLDVHAVDHRDPLGEHLHLDLRFVVLAPPGAVEDPNHESLDHRWVTWDELPGAVDEDGIVRLAEAGRAALGELDDAAAP
ncbi:NUDIX hydrolase [Dermatobacter hominis]|uniref:NUDIX hydrolase n=1 Tax=Dermatobacter hominis TaxID=2884263 RepID=UPI001D12EC3A|nr:NUDIX hydrolase [Dermatobacter hominis]UDY36233.1 NUDIX hydrolase [Dermatobacter hominis]